LDEAPLGVEIKELAGIDFLPHIKIYSKPLLCFTVLK
jgi:hypothetical protein